ncbi:MetB protein [Verrucomicrobia bacterium]|nr:MetB protein [Verrucomicrobiota bacterium]
MDLHELFERPLCKAEDLGRPLPDTIHSVSVAMPKWEHVVGYEEKRPEVMAQIKSAYPRFVVHPLVQQLAAQIAPGRVALPFPSARAARQCAEFIRRASGTSTEIIPARGVHVVATTAAGEAALRSFWQHTGLIVSSRQAEALLAGRTDAAEADAVRRSLRRQLAGFYDCAEDDVFLAPTGMGAIFAALCAVNQRTPEAPSVQLGFPYGDTLKLQQKLGTRGMFLHALETLAAELQGLLQRGALSACFCEVPGNPLLGTADLRRISPLLRAQRVPLIADDTVSTPLNVDLSGQADLWTTSLTKFLSGTCNVMGGALICNPKSPLYPELKPIVQAQHEELLWGEDAAVVDAQALSFPARMKQHNHNGLLLAERLRRHPAIEHVWYPKWESSEAYDALRRPEGGWGALLTFVPKNAAATSPAIYDRLPVCKGPNLGTIFTLACPFTLLAHFNELDWAESCGVSRYLIRLSVGLEDPDQLWQRISRCLDSAIGESGARCSSERKDMKAAKS